MSRRWITAAVNVQWTAEMGRYRYVHQDCKPLVFAGDKGTGKRLQKGLEKEA